ncbi:MAG: heavy metal-associated domain-containing protein [Bacteroidota bacterium]
MEIKVMKFKTNINCPHCLAKVSSALNAQPEIDQWQVDLHSPEKILTIEGDISAEKIIELITQTGYKAELI